MSPGLQLALANFKMRLTDYSADRAQSTELIKVMGDIR